MLKVLFLSHASTWGGAEKCLHLLLGSLPRDQFHPLVVLPGEGDLKTAIDRLGVETRVAPLKWWVGFDVADGRYPQAFAEGLDERVAHLARMIEEESIGLVVTNTSVLADGALAAAQCGVPHVWHIHEILSKDPFLQPFLPMENQYQWIGALSRKIVVVAEAVREEIEQFIPSTKIEVVHNGIPVLEPSIPPRSKEDLFGLSEDTPIVTFLGQLSERKGVLDLEAAAKQVLERFPTARFVLAGPDGERADALRERIARDGLSGEFLLLGPRKDVADILAASDLLVLPSLTDPLPLVVLEAMGLGKPVVATRCGGIPEMVVHGETGLLVPVANPPALASAILTILQSPETGREMGRRGHERFQTHFNTARHAAHIQRIFLEAAANGPEPLDRGIHVAINGLLRSYAFQQVAMLGRFARFQQEIVRHEAEAAQLHGEIAQLRSELATALARVERFENHPILRRALEARRKMRQMLRHDASSESP